MSSRSTARRSASTASSTDAASRRSPRPHDPRNGQPAAAPDLRGNRLPGVIGAIDAYHLAKRYGVAHGATAIVATQSNFGYRLALRLHDAGVAVRRIADPRVNPQSRFVDFAKASGEARRRIPQRPSRGGEIARSVRKHWNDDHRRTTPMH
jgi:hypothetical protein